MFEINPHTNKVKLTKGDTATIEVNITDLDNKKYKPTSADKIILTVRKNVNSPTVALSVEADGDFPKLIILPSDTKDLEAGLYVYDIQLLTNENVYTIVQSKSFQILPEVGQ